MREAERRVVVDRVCGVVPGLVRVAEVGEVGGIGVAVQEDDVVGVDSPDGLDAPVVPIDKTGLVWVGRLVHDVVPRDPEGEKSAQNDIVKNVRCEPWVALIVLRQLLPQPYSAVLEVLVHPEVGNVNASVGVPALVLHLLVRTIGNTRTKTLA
jgi:hypothetical protein